MFSQLFPKTTFASYPNGINSAADVKEVLDIFRRFRFIDKFSNVKNYQTYYVRTGETPDMVASKFYGNSEWYWLLMVFNDLVDPFRDWPRAGFDTNNASIDYSEDVISFLPQANNLYPFSVGDIIIRCDINGNVNSNDQFTGIISRTKNDLFSVYIDIENSAGRRLAEGEYFGVLENDSSNTATNVHQVKLARTPITAIDHFETSDGRILSPFTFRSAIGTPNERVLNPSEGGTNLTTTLIYQYINDPDGPSAQYFRSIQYANEQAYDQKRRIKIFPPERRREAYEAAAELLAKLPSAGRTSRLSSITTSQLSLI